jgi:hypothetical protein
MGGRFLTRTHQRWQPHPNHNKTMIHQTGIKPPQPVAVAVAEAESLVGVASTDLLARWFSERQMEITRAQFEGAGIDCPMEILVIAAVLGGLIESAEDHAVDLEADGFHLMAEEARQRRDGYDNSRQALFDSWG